MRAFPGARIVMAATHVGEPTRDGRIVEVRGEDGGPPYVVEWSDGHTGLLFPGPGSVLHVSEKHEDGGRADAGTGEAGMTQPATGDGSPASAAQPAAMPSITDSWVPSCRELDSTIPAPATSAGTSSRRPRISTAPSGTVRSRARTRCW